MSIKLNSDYVSSNNTNGGTITPRYIVIHNTDNYNAGANALAHARSQYNGNFQNMSAHWYTDDGNIAYQAAPHSKGCWHVGVNYGGALFGTASNNNTVGIEMCVNNGYNYEQAFQNTVELTKYLMQQLGIPSDRVVQHYDVCGKNCPSAIRANGDWGRFKSLISSGASSTVNQNSTSNPTMGAGEKIQYVGRCTGNSVNVRRGAGMEYSNIDAWPVLNEGNLVDVIAREGDWHKIRIAGQHIGYIYSQYLEKVEDNFKTFVGACTGNSVNVRRGPGMNYANIDGWPVLNEGNLVDVIAREGDWHKIRIAEQYIGYIYSQYLEKVEDNFKTFVGACTGNSVNVRRGPGMNYANIDGWPVLNEGNLVDVIGEEGDWYNIRIANQHIGYIAKAYIK